MRISKLLLRNYRQFRNVDITFDANPDKKDLHIFIGVMGTGKTNLLNAINWCLYGEEPFLSKEGVQQLPRLNLKTIEKSESDINQNASVQIWAEANGKHIVFTREESFRIEKPKSSGKEPVCKSLKEIFKVNIEDKEGNIKLFEDEESKTKVELFVPKGIRDFFFFDGERLDKYFKEATGQNIQNAIYQISQVDLLDKMRKNLEKVIVGLRKDAGKLSPEIEQTREELEKREKDLAQSNKEIVECEKQISIAKEKIADNAERLRSIPHIEELQNRRSLLKEEINGKEELYKKKEIEKQSLLFNYGISIMLYPLIKKAIHLIQKKKENKELPPTVDKNLLEKILLQKICICGREIKSQSREKNMIKDLLDSIKLSSEVAQELLRMETPLDLAQETIQLFLKTNSEITKELKSYETDLKYHQKEIDDIDAKVGGYDLEKIKHWHSELKNFEEIFTTNHQRLGVLKSGKNKTQADIDKLNLELETELKKESKVADLKKNLDFTEKAITILRSTKDDIMEKIRKKIENKTEEKFFELHWKKETYKEVRINNDYMISPIHALGYECLGTLSGGEREILALSFSIALHNISGFDSSIVIDRPLAMVSGKTREYIAKVLSKISDERQILLLLTPEDYGSDVSGILDVVASSKMKMALSSDEKELKVETL